MEIEAKLDLILEMLRTHSQRFDQIEYRLDLIEKRLDKIEANQQIERTRLDEVYLSRDKVKIEFGWHWSIATLIICTIVASLTHFI